MPRAMKDSGVEWLGDIPADWDCCKLKYLISSLNSGTSITATDLTEKGYPVYGGGQQIGFFSQFNMEDTLIIGRVGSCGCVTKILGKAWATDNALIVTTDFPINYLYYILVAAELNKLSTSNAQPLITSGKVLNHKVAVCWNKNEQQRIAAFLNDKCARIDNVIEKTRASIVEYKKLKQAIITRAVTKGMRPARTMKDSGIEWLGDIPADWELVPIKHLCSYNDEVLQENTDPDFTFDYIEIGSVEFGRGIIEMQRIRFADAPSRARRIVHENDIIVSTVRTYLKAVASIPHSDLPLIASTGFVVVRPRNVNHIFLKYAILSSTTISKIEANSVGISYPAINASQVVRFKIPVPSLDEQKEIASYLDGKTAAIDSLIEKKGRLVTELERLKKSLIFEYVTGKKEAPERT